jgi:hypothetical protein
LADNVLPACLVAARHADEQASLQHVVGDGNLRREPHRIVGRHHDPKLPVHQPLGELAEIDVQHQRIGRYLQTLGMRVMLDVGNAPITKPICGLDQLDQTRQHILIGFVIASNRTAPRHLRGVSESRINLENDLGHCLPPCVFSLAPLSGA